VNLRCPFGCRVHHRRQCSNQRSAAYNGSPKGKKARARRQRCLRESSGKHGASRADEPIAPPLSGDDTLSEVSLPNAELRLEALVLDSSSVVTSPMLPYVRMLVSLIEGVQVSMKELRIWLCQVLIQHSIARRRRADYVLAFLHQHPP
jgi:hypothetical protein